MKRRAWAAATMFASIAAAITASQWDARAQPPARGPAPSATATARGPAPIFDAGARAQPIPNQSGVDSGVVEVRQLDGGTQEFKFGEVDIEGRLKSPTLVYFLRRVRAEFAAGDLGHRSFLRELSQTRNDPSF